MFVIKLQEWIHRFEVGAGARLVRGLFLAFAFVGVALLYDSFCYRNLATEEAMDSAQLARNLAEGRGFKTKVVRPFSMYLISKHRPDKKPLIDVDHPDIANAPVYPLLLAPIVKLTPAQDLAAKRIFSVAWSDLAIAMFNQLLLLVSLGLVYLLARRWFDRTVAMIAALLFGLTELYWRFSVSGLSTNLLIVLALLLAFCLSGLEERSRDNRGGVISLAAVIGLLLGLISLTRYSCGFLIIPVVVFIAAFVTQRRVMAIAACVGVFALCLAPWVARNMLVCGQPFGVAGYAPMEQMRTFPGDRLQRSLHPPLSQLSIVEYGRKLTSNAREVISTDLPRMGGNWLWALFLAGLLLRFRSPTLSHLRWFIILALLTLIPVQALVRTENWSASPDLNSENLLVVLSPLVLIFGVGVFFVLLDSIEFPSMPVRYAAWGGFVFVISLPLMLALLPPHPWAVNYPPYFPPRLQDIGAWLTPNDLMMSDVPAGVAWYGKRQALATTSGGKDEFMEIHDFIKPIRGLYLTSATTERKLVANFMRGERTSWEAFALETAVKAEVPAGFPLKHAHSGFFHDGQILLMDYDRWRSGRKNP